MAAALKEQYGEAIPQNIASMLKKAYHAFDTTAFVDGCLRGYQQLELTARARHISAQMRIYLPEDFAQSCDIITQSLPEPLANTNEFGMGPFIYLPHVFYAAEYGLNDFENAMRLQYELTQRFTAEFSIRAFIQAHPDKTLERLNQWCTDPSPHVRRLVSEGTRTRLPWASRLPEFQQDPTPVFALLEKLKDDESLYVRRSVANNLNDIYKDNPLAVKERAKTWLQGADKNRRWLINHALRSAVKAGDKQALEILGFNKPENVDIGKSEIKPSTPRLGEAVEIGCTITNCQQHAQPLMIDAKVYFVKANGQTSAKVFKLKKVELSANQTVTIRKKIALKQLTTRMHYPGKHDVSVILNGIEHSIGHFDLLAE